MTDFIDIIDYEGLYKINSNGEIINSKGQIRKPFQIYSKYLCIDLYKNNNRKKYLIHRLVAKHFLNNFSDELEVDHIDNNRQNNNINNLRMVNRSQQSLNVKKQKNCSSKYIGVSKIKNTDKWDAKFRGKRIGIYENENDAGIAVNNEIIRLNLIEYRKLNIIQ